jgi:hypothetical protein
MGILPVASEFSTVREGNRSTRHAPSRTFGSALARRSSRALRRLAF